MRRCSGTLQNIAADARGCASAKCLRRFYKSLVDINVTLYQKPYGIQKQRIAVGAEKQRVCASHIVMEAVVRRVDTRFGKKNVNLSAMSSSYEILLASPIFSGLAAETSLCSALQ